MATTVTSPTAIELFYSYAHCDEPLCVELQKHLTALKRSGLISDWYDRKIEPGSEWALEIQHAMERAGIILLLVSADFLASKYIFEVELPFALQRQRNGQAKVIPILLRPVEWHDLPFAKLQVLPTSARPVTSWPSPDEAFSDIAGRLRELLYAERLHQTPALPAETATQERVLDAAIASTVVIDEPTDVVTMFRTTDSGGLKAILQLDHTYSPHPEDVKSNTVEIDFPRDPSGKLLPTALTLALQAPGCDPPVESKQVRIPPTGDTSVFVFMLTPKRAGTIRPNLRILVGELEIGSRLLITRAVPAAEAQQALAYNVISWPVSATLNRFPATHARIFDSEPQLASAALAPAPIDFSPRPKQSGKRSNRNIWLAVGSSAAAVLLVATVSTQFRSLNRSPDLSSSPGTIIHEQRSAAVQSLPQLRTRLDTDRQQFKKRGPHSAAARANELIDNINSNLRHAETALSSSHPEEAQRYLHDAQIDLAALESAYNLHPPKH